MQKTTPGKIEHPAASDCGKAYALGITTGKTQHSLRMQQQQYIAFCLKTDSDVVTLPYDPKLNEFPGLIVEH